MIPAALPPAVTEYETGWVAEAMWMSWRHLPNKTKEMYSYVDVMETLAK